MTSRGAGLKSPVCDDRLEVVFDAFDFPFGVCPVLASDFAAFLGGAVVLGAAS